MHRSARAKAFFWGGMLLATALILAVSLSRNPSTGRSPSSGAGAPALGRMAEPAPLRGGGPGAAPHPWAAGAAEPRSSGGTVPGSGAPAAIPAAVERGRGLRDPGEPGPLDGLGGEERPKKLVRDPKARSSADAAWGAGAAPPFGATASPSAEAAALRGARAIDAAPGAGGPRRAPQAASPAAARAGPAGSSMSRKAILASLAEAARPPDSREGEASGAPAGIAADAPAIADSGLGKGPGSVRTGATSPSSRGAGSESKKEDEEPPPPTCADWCDANCKP